MKFFIN